MVAEGLAVIKTGLDIAKTTKDLLSSSKDKDIKFYDRLARALRLIYFPPTGVLGLLKDIAADKAISDDRVKSVLIDFNDYEWKVKATLDSLGFDKLQGELGLSIATVRMLHDIRNGKAGLRQAVQEEINAYGQKAFKPNKARIQELISNIEALNSEIEDIEAVINLRTHR
jgi:hypothetical protein